MARTNPEGKALITKLVQGNPEITLGEAQRAAKEAKVKFSPPSFYSWKREALGGGGGRRGPGRPARSAGGNGMWGQVQAQLENAQRMEQALRQIADILDKAVGRR